MSAVHDRIIEIGVIKIVDGQEVERFETLLNPERTISSYITGITGITTEDIERAPTFAEIAQKLLELLQGSIFVAHNARFDYGFVRNEFKRIGIHFTAKQLCTVKLSRRLFPEYPTHHLDAIMQRFAISCTMRHRALSDAEVVWKFLQHSSKYLSEEKIEAVLKEMLHKPVSPPHLSSEVVAGLPENPGVYIFYGAEGEVLYVGKSITIKNRVLSHFTASLSSTIEMKMFNQITDIQTISTIGELGALLLESELVKSLMPLYNRRLRKTKKLVVLKKRILTQGYTSVALDYYENIPPSELSELLGIFRSRKQAEDFLRNLTKVYTLCPKLLGLQKTTGPCFQYQLGKCLGACLEKEPPASYNIRFDDAFSRTRIRSWPYKGAVIFEDRDTSGDQGELFIIQNWCLLGAVKFEGELVEQFLKGSSAFDFESYKIMVHFLLDKKNRRKLREISSVEAEHILSQV
jgi:DNA polymerase-3 subunit epsilon